MSTEIVPNQNDINRQHALKIGKQAMKTELKTLKEDAEKEWVERKEELRSYTTPFIDNLVSELGHYAVTVVESDEVYLALKTLSELSDLEEREEVSLTFSEYSIVHTIRSWFASPQLERISEVLHKPGYTFDVAVRIEGIDCYVCLKDGDTSNIAARTVAVELSEQQIQKIEKGFALRRAVLKCEERISELQDRLYNIDEYMEELEATLLVEELKNTTGGDKVIEMTQNILGRSLGTSARLLPALEGTHESTTD